MQAPLSLLELQCKFKEAEKLTKADGAEKSKFRKAEEKFLEIASSQPPNISDVGGPLVGELHENVLKEFNALKGEAYHQAGWIRTMKGDYREAVVLIKKSFSYDYPSKDNARFCYAAILDSGRSCPKSLLRDCWQNFMSRIRGQLLCWGLCPKDLGSDIGVLSWGMWRRHHEAIGEYDKLASSQDKWIACWALSNLARIYFDHEKDPEQGKDCIVKATNIAVQILAEVSHDCEEMKAKGMVTLGALIVDPRNPKFDLQRACEYFRDASACGDARGHFWYGRALMKGFGCEKNEYLGMKHIHEAAKASISRALFEVALCHERGTMPGSEGRINLPQARIYFKALSERKGRPLDWEDELEVYMLYENDELRRVEEVIGVNFGTLLSWQLAGQAFLIGAAAELAGADKPLSNYHSLLLAVPTMGLLLSMSYTCLGIHHVLRRERSRYLPEQVYKAKAEAVKVLLGPDKVRTWVSPKLIFWTSRLGEIFAIALGIYLIYFWATLLNNTRIIPSNIAAVQPVNATIAFCFDPQSGLAYFRKNASVCVQSSATINFTSIPTIG